MMPPVFQALKASTAVKDIVGTNPPRIYRHGEAPTQTDKPYITWFLVSGVPENNLSNTPPVDRQTVQVDYWHPTAAGIDLLSDAGRDALELVATMTNVILDQRDLESRLYRIAQQFDFFGR